MHQGVKFIESLGHRIYHLDDDPAKVTDWQGNRVFTDDELPTVRAGVARCFATMQDPFYFLCQAGVDVYDRTELVYFEFRGHAIHNPTMSECGRMAVPPDYYGFELVTTGGGNTAWRLDLPDQRYLLLTDSEGAPHEFKQGAPILLGMYDVDGEPIAHSELTAGAL
jgi:hypothetical protein